MALLLNCGGLIIGIFLGLWGLVKARRQRKIADGLRWALHEIMKEKEKHR